MNMSTCLRAIIPSLQSAAICFTATISSVWKSRGQVWRRISNSAATLSRPGTTSLPISPASADNDFIFVSILAIAVKPFGYRRKVFWL